MSDGWSSQRAQFGLSDGTPPISENFQPFRQRLTSDLKRSAMHSIYDTSECSDHNTPNQWLWRALHQIQSRHIWMYDKIWWEWQAIQMAATIGSESKSDALHPSKAGVPTAQHKDSVDLTRTPSDPETSHRVLCEDVMSIAMGSAGLVFGIGRYRETAYVWHWVMCWTQCATFVVCGCNAKVACPTSRAYCTLYEYIGGSSHRSFTAYIP